MGCHVEGWEEHFFGNVVVAKPQLVLDLSSICPLQHVAGFRAALLQGYDRKKSGRSAGVWSMKNFVYSLVLAVKFHRFSGFAFK